MAFVILYCSVLIQELFASSCAIVLCFLCTSSKRCGARFLGASLSSQAWCQNLVFFPLPIVMVVDALNKRRSISVQGISRPAQGLFSACHFCHNHRIRRALPNLSRSNTPRLPRSFGLLTVGQLTRQWPPFATSSPFQRKERHILSICFLAQTASGKIVRWYTGMEDSTKVTKVNRPARFRSFPFQPWRRCPIFSIKGCT